LLDAYQQDGDVDVLRQAVAVLRQAERESAGQGVGRTVLLYFLAHALHLLFEATGDDETVEEEAWAAMAAVQAMPDGYAGRHAVCFHLGISLWQLCRKNNDPRVLTPMTNAFRDACAAVPPGNSARDGYVRQLGNALMVRRALWDDRSCLSEEVEVLRDVLAAISPDDHERGEWLTLFIDALWEHYQDTGDTDLLAEGLRAYRGVMTLPASYLPLEYRARSASFLVSESRELVDDGALMTEQVHADRLAVATVKADSPYRAVVLYNLSVSLRALAGETADDEAAGLLLDAIAAGRESVSVTEPADEQLPVRLTSVFMALTEWRERTGDRSRLAEEVAAGRAAVTATGRDDPQLPSRAVYFGFALSLLVEAADEAERAALLAEAAASYRYLHHPRFWIAHTHTGG
jgi:hypothetical protein